MGTELGKIWNAFLRGQLTIVLITIIVYAIVLGAIGVNYFFGLALLAGLARFVPYIGPFIAWTTYGIVTLLQGTTIFGLEPIWYAILVILVAIVIDFFLDNAVTPRLMGNALQVHPAAIMIAALVFASLIGVVGVMLAAPVLATVMLITIYILKKLFDQDPWADLDKYKTTEPHNGWRPVKKWLEKLGEWISNWYKKTWPNGLWLINKLNQASKVVDAWLESLNRKLGRKDLGDKHEHNN